MMSFGTWPRTERHWILDTRGGHLPPLPFQIVPAFRFQSEGHAVQVPSQEGPCGGEAGWNAVVELTQSGTSVSAQSGWHSDGGVHVGTGTVSARTFRSRSRIPRMVGSSSAQRPTGLFYRPSRTPPPNRSPLSSSGLVLRAAFTVKPSRRYPTMRKIGSFGTM